MTPNATVIIVKATGNVLGFVTHEGGPDRGLTPAEVAGDAFPVRDATSGDVLADLPVAELGTAAVPVVDDLLKTPQACVVAGGQATLGDSDPTAHSVAIAADGITVTVATAAIEREVRVFVEHGQGSDRERSVHTGKIAATKSDVKIAATFDAGHYDLVAAVAGHELLTKASDAVP